MATRDIQEELERQRVEQGQQFLKQLGEMFAQTRVDMASQYVPQGQHRTEMEHVNQAIERVAVAVEKLTGNVGNFHENAPRIFADRAETKQDIAELRTEIEKLKTARESDIQRGADWRYQDQAQRYRGDAASERGWRSNAQQSGTQVLGWVIAGASALLLTAINIIVVLALNHR